MNGIPVAGRDIWKIYGTNARSALAALRASMAQGQSLDKDAIRERFGCVVGVAGISFEVKEGETFCVMGLSGSGKSTLLRHINRLIEPTAGQIEVFGTDVAGLDRRALQQLRAGTIGMVFQHMALWPHRSVRDNVAFGLEVRSVGRGERYRAAEQALELVQLAGWADRYPDELSGGMQQRVGLARALAADPPILLMDEPFSALDPLIRRDLQAQFVALVRSMRKTTLFITHDLEEALRIGDRIAIMKDGVFRQVGTPEEILLHPADQYVADFIRGISHLHVLTARRIMQAGPAPAEGRRIAADAKLAEVLDAVMAGSGPVAVSDGATVIGSVTREGLLTAIRGQVG